MRASIRKALSIVLLGATLAMPVMLAQKKGAHKNGANRGQGGRRGGVKKSTPKGGGRGGRNG